MANTLTKEIKKSRPNIADSSIKAYVSNLEKLKKLFDEDDLMKIVKSIDKVKDKLSDKTGNTQRNYFNAIIIWLMAVDGDKDLIKEYNDIRDELNKKYEDEQASGKISDKQKENFVEMEELEKMSADMDKEIKSKKLKKKENLTSKERALVQVFVLFSLYTRLPLRNDVSEMSAITKREYNKLSDKEKKEHNYLVVNKADMFMVLNKYKTSKKYEENKIDIGKDLEKILRMWIRMEGMGILFKSSTGKPLSRNAISQLMIKTTKKYLNKSISTTMIRKIYLSSKYANVKEDMEKDAKIMGHDVSTQQKVYVKKGQEDSQSQDS